MNADHIDTCLERFSEVPQQVFHKGNSTLLTGEYEGDRQFIQLGPYWR